MQMGGYFLLLNPLPILQKVKLTPKFSVRKIKIYIFNAPLALKEARPS
jgi:hypothetical protein